MGKVYQTSIHYVLFSFPHKIKNLCNSCINSGLPCFRGCAWILSLFHASGAVPEYSFFHASWAVPEYSLSSMFQGLCLNTLSSMLQGCARILSLPCFRAVPEYSFFQTPWYFIISLFLPQVQLFQAVVSFLNTLINSRLRVNIYVQQVVGANLLWSVVCPLWCYHQYVTRCDVTINISTCDSWYSNFPVTINLKLYIVLLPFMYL